MHVDSNYFIFAKYFSESKLLKVNISKKYTFKNFEQFQAKLSVTGSLYVQNKFKNHKSDSQKYFEGLNFMNFF